MNLSDRLKNARGPEPEQDEIDGLDTASNTAERTPHVPDISDLYYEGEVEGKRSIFGKIASIFQKKAPTPDKAAKVAEEAGEDAESQPTSAFLSEEQAEARRAALERRAAEEAKIAAAAEAGERARLAALKQREEAEARAMAAANNPAAVTDIDDASDIASVESATPEPPSNQFGLFSPADPAEADGADADPFNTGPFDTDMADTDMEDAAEESQSQDEPFGLSIDDLGSFDADAFAEREQEVDEAYDAALLGAEEIVLEEVHVAPIQEDEAILALRESAEVPDEDEDFWSPYAQRFADLQVTSAEANAAGDVLVREADNSAATWAIDEDTPEVGDIVITPFSDATDFNSADSGAGAEDGGSDGAADDDPFASLLADDEPEADDLDLAFLADPLLESTGQSDAVDETIDAPVEGPTENHVEDMADYVIPVLDDPIEAANPDAIEVLDAEAPLPSDRDLGREPHDDDGHVTADNPFGFTNTAPELDGELDAEPESTEPASTEPADSFDIPLLVDPLEDDDWSIEAALEDSIEVDPGLLPEPSDPLDELIPLTSGEPETPTDIETNLVSIDDDDFSPDYATDVEHEFGGALTDDFGSDSTLGTSFDDLPPVDITELLGDEAPAPDAIPDPEEDPETRPDPPTLLEIEPEPTPEPRSEIDADIWDATHPEPTVSEGAEPELMDTEAEIDPELATPVPTDEVWPAAQAEEATEDTLKGLAAIGAEPMLPNLDESVAVSTDDLPYIEGEVGPDYEVDDDGTPMRRATDFEQGPSELPQRAPGENDTFGQTMTWDLPPTETDTTGPVASLPAPPMIEDMPLAPEPSDPPPKSNLARFLRRKRGADTLHTDAESAHKCPSCGAPARTELTDTGNQMLHMSCDECFKMWQVPLT